MENCIFCKIAAGEIPSNKLYEDELCLAFYDIEPLAPKHFLVIPRQHLASAAEINADNSALVAHIFEVIAKLAAGIPRCSALAIRSQMRASRTRSSSLWAQDSISFARSMPQLKLPSCFPDSTWKCRCGTV